MDGVTISTGPEVSDLRLWTSRNHRTRCLRAFNSGMLIFFVTCEGKHKDMLHGQVVITSSSGERVKVVTAYVRQPWILALSRDSAGKKCVEAQE